jgi:hypothetical protein
MVSKRKKHSPGATQTPFPAAKDSRVAVGTPNLEVQVSEPLLDRQTFATLLSGSVSSAHTKVTSQTRRSTPASPPVVDSAIPTFKPSPPPSRFVNKRASGRDVY